MENLFHSYWWLLFPLGWMVYGAFQSFLNYRRQRDALNLIRTYADKGQQPPEALLKVLDRPIDVDADEGGQGWSRRGNDGNWFSVVLFGVMALGFGYGASTDMYGAQDALIIVTVVLVALSLASLVSALRGGQRR